MTTLDPTTHDAMMATDSVTSVRKYRAPRRLIMTALVLGWLFDWAFYDKTLGLSVLLYAGVLVSALISSGFAEDVKLERRGLWLLIPIAAFGVMAFVRANEFLTFLNISGVVLLLMLYAYYFSAENIITQSILSYLIVPLKMMTVPWFTSLRVLAEARQTAPENDSENKLPIVPIVRGLLLALPILFVFTLLLISADIVFAQRIEAWFNTPDFSDLFTRFLLIAWISWVALGALAYALTRGQEILSPEQQAKVGIEKLETKQWFSLGFIESSIVLGMVNILFSLFVSIQFAYLFGGLKNIKLDGYTFAEYARKGFFELVVVAILVLAMLLVLKGLSSRTTEREAIVFKSLSTLMVALVTVMLVSAFRRLSIYEWTYGFSELRLYSHVFIIWLGITLFWFVGTLWRRPDRFAIGLFVAVIGFVMTLNIVNPDAFIVRQNWRRFQLMEPYLGSDDANVNLGQVIRGVSVANARSNPSIILDLYYLTRLSDDAVPELIKINGALLQTGNITVNDNLIQRGWALTRWQEEQPWQSAHWGYSRALRLLSAEFDPALFEY
ncbi:MAG: DUF4153 domain-containing protein [Candidatus Promineifilaceae bacterium]